MKNSSLISLVLMTAAVFASGIATADRRIPVDVSWATSASSLGGLGLAFNGKWFENSDAARWAYFDLGAKYHLTRIRYTGRTGACETRLRNSSFLGSNDGEIWTTIYKVPSDFVQLVNTTNELDLSTQNVVTRHVGWKDVDYGSISEIEWWTDSNLLKFSMISVFDPDPTGAILACKITKDGDVPAGDISVVAYKALKDYGENFDDWKNAEGVVTEDLGSYESGVEKKIHVNSLSGPTYVRFLAYCGTVTNFMLSAAVFENDPNPITYAKWRQLGKNAVECKVPHYIGSRIWNVDHMYRLFDDNDTTAAVSPLGVTDYGRPIRIDKVQFTSTGSPGIPVQGSNDGWYWTTITNRISTDPLVVDLKLRQPQVYRYFRSYNEPSPSVPLISEIRFYTATNAPYVAINNETEGLRTRTGCHLGGTVFVGGTNAIANVTLRAWIADRDYGLDEAKWLAAGVKPVTNGVFAAGSTFAVGPLAGESGKINYVRLQAVSDVIGCANGFGGLHAFTMADEVRVQVAKEGAIWLMTNYTGRVGSSTKQFSVTDAENMFKYQLFGAGNMQIEGDYNPFGCKLPRRFRVTRLEWIPRYETGCHDRCGGAKFYLSDEKTLPALNSASWTQVGKGNTTAGWCSKLNQIYVGGMKAQYFKQQGDANGNEQVRIWGEVIPPGFIIVVR